MSAAVMSMLVIPRIVRVMRATRGQRNQRADDEKKHQPYLSYNRWIH